MSFPFLIDERAQVERCRPSGLEEVCNFRDLGGRLGKLGSVRHDVIFRSGSLHRATETDALALARRRIRTVIDLRTTDERLAEPGYGEWVPPRVVHIPLGTGLPKDVGATGRTRPSYLADRYLAVLERDAAAICTCLDVLAELDLPALFHCTSGTDRTGLLAAVLLGVLDCGPVTIADEYEQSSLDPGTGAWCAGPVSAPSSVMVQALRRLLREWGDLGIWAAANGAAPVSISTLRRRLLTPTPVAAA